MKHACVSLGQLAHRAQPIGQLLPWPCETHAGQQLARRADWLLDGARRTRACARASFLCTRKNSRTLRTFYSERRRQRWEPVGWEIVIADMAWLWLLSGYCVESADPHEFARRRGTAWLSAEAPRGACALASRVLILARSKACSSAALWVPHTDKFSLGSGAMEPLIKPQQNKIASLCSCWELQTRDGSALFNVYVARS